jgi:Domain of unknown function (DUF5122) beta-propeller
MTRGTTMTRTSTLITLAALVASATYLVSTNEPAYAAPPPSCFNAASAVVPLADGGVLLGGGLGTNEFATAPDSSFVIAEVMTSVVSKLSADGELDASWGVGGSSDGLVPSEAMSRPPIIDAVALPDGTTIVLAYLESTNNRVVKLTAAGKVDSTFGDNGSVLATVEGDKTNSGLALDAKARFVIWGVSKGVTKIRRLLSSGQPDPSFGTSGAIELRSTKNVEAVDVAVDGNDLVVLETDAKMKRTTIARYLESGKPDRVFGVRGRTKVTWPKQQSFLGSGLGLGAGGNPAGVAKGQA